MTARTLWVLLVLVALANSKNVKKKILSFGGNGMIGSEVMHKMIQSDEYDITMVSRGKWHFDSNIRVQPYVKSVICDRGKEMSCAGEADCDINSLRNCTDLMEAISSTDQFYAVLDFSAYEAKWVHDAVDVLKGKTRLYVYISTDSVYEVCQDKGSNRPTRETDAVRPKDLKKRKELKAADRYGDAKLAGEEALVDQREDENGFPWIALRFADVIGPRDTTDRWFIYQFWIKFYEVLQMPISVPPPVVNLKQSLTYTDDAAQAVILAVESTSEAWDNAYNIAMEEETTLWDTCKKMAEIMGVDGLEQDNTPDEKSFYLFPTVFNGPIDIAKAKEKLGFKPTALDSAFRTTIDWYNDIFIRDEQLREDMLSRLVAFGVPREKKDKLYLAVEEELEKHGVVNERYRKKRKGDLGDIDEHEEL